MSFFDFPIYTPGQDDSGHIAVPTRSGPIAIFINQGDYGEKEQALLSKIIGATGNLISDVSITELSENDIVPIHHTWNYQKGLDIIFGVDKRQLMLQSEVHPYYLLCIDKRTLLFCDKLTTLSQDADKKKALWGRLKTYFEL